MSAPAAYEHTTETQTTSGPPPIGPRFDYAKSLRGLLKLSEIALSLFMLICASIDYWSHLGGGWVQFVAATAMICTAVLFVLHFMNISSRIPIPWITMELGYYGFFCLLLLISLIVCAVRAHLTAAIGAALFFNICVLIVFAVDTYFCYQAYQSQAPAVNSNVTTTTTTETRTSYETQTQY